MYENLARAKYMADHSKTHNSLIIMDLLCILYPVFFGVSLYGIINCFAGQRSSSAGSTNWLFMLLHMHNYTYPCIDRDTKNF